VAQSATKLPPPTDQRAETQPSPDNTTTEYNAAAAKVSSKTTAAP